jgi:hypothetical protein
VVPSVSEHYSAFVFVFKCLFGHLEPKMKALQYFRMLGDTYPTTVCNFSADLKIQLLFLLSAGPTGSERRRG